MKHATVSLSPLFAAVHVVSAGDRLFASLGLGEPVEVIGAANGKTIRTLKGTEGVEEIVHKDVVISVDNLPSPQKGKEQPAETELVEQENITWSFNAGATSRRRSMCIPVRSRTKWTRHPSLPGPIITAVGGTRPPASTSSWAGPAWS